MPGCWKRSPFYIASVCLVAVVAAQAQREKPITISDERSILTAPFNIASLNRLGLVALGGTPGDVGTFLPAFDRRTDSKYVAKEAGPAHLDVIFARPQTVRSVALHLGEGNHRWRAVTAESALELEKPDRVKELIAERPGTGVGVSSEVKLPEGTLIRALRLIIVPDAQEVRVSVRELNLVGDQKLESISLDASSNAAPIGDMLPLRIKGYFSGGDVREMTVKKATWRIVPEQAARMAQHQRLVAKRRGVFSVTVTVGELRSQALTLEGVEAN